MAGFLFSNDTGIVAGVQLYFADEDGCFLELATDEGEKGLIFSLS
jgi:hypothetical protein